MSESQPALPPAFQRLARDWVVIDNMTKAKGRLVLASGRVIAGESALAIGLSLATHNYL
jgi:hypothetical protein